MANEKVPFEHFHHRSAAKRNEPGPGGKELKAPASVRQASLFERGRQAQSDVRAPQLEARVGIGRLSAQIEAENGNTREWSSGWTSYTRGSSERHRYPSAARFPSSVHNLRSPSLLTLAMPCAGSEIAMAQTSPFRHDSNRIAFMRALFWRITRSRFHF